MPQTSFFSINLRKHEDSQPVLSLLCTVNRLGALAWTHMNFYFNGRIPAEFPQNIRSWWSSKMLPDVTRMMLSVALDTSLPRSLVKETYSTPPGGSNALNCQSPLSRWEKGPHTVEWRERLKFYQLRGRLENYSDSRNLILFNVPVGSETLLPPFRY